MHPKGAGLWSGALRFFEPPKDGQSGRRSALVSAAHGSGPGAIARDGCAVDLYAAMPPAPEAALVCAALPPAQAILELGAGAGRMTHPLVAAGHRVVAVDESAEMLARIRGAETVEARIEDLRLAERFDVVLLASHLVNEPDAQTRTALLDACARHVGDDGCVLVERHPPAWFEDVRPGTTAAGALTMTLRDVGRPEPGLVEATIAYRLDERTWTQRFMARRIDDDQLAEALAASGLRLAGFLDDACAWARAELLRPRPRTRPRRAATAAMPPGSSGSPRG